VSHLHVCHGQIEVVFGYIGEFLAAGSDYVNKMYLVPDLYTAIDQKTLESLHTGLQQWLEVVLPNVGKG
jgi:hypothetical protein